MTCIQSNKDEEDREGWWHRGTSLKRNSDPPKDHHKSLGAGLLKGPRGGWVLMSEVPCIRILCGSWPSFGES